MLTRTDVHRLVGMLSVEIELGSRVLDEASGTKRDVDTRPVNGDRFDE